MALSLIITAIPMTRSLLPLLFLAVTLTACVTEDERPATSLEAGDRLPAFTVTLDDGSSVSNLDFADAIGVIALFNTSCGDCRMELPHLQSAYEECLGTGLPVKFVCIAREESAASIAAYWESAALTMPYSPQADRSVYSLFATSGIPRVYITAPSPGGATIEIAYTDTAPPSAVTLTSVIRRLTDRLAVSGR